MSFLADMSIKACLYPLSPFREFLNKRMISTIIHIGFPIVTGFYAASLIAGLFRRHSLSCALLGVGWLGHTVFLVIRAGFIGIWSPYAFFEESFFLPWCLAALALGLRFIPGKASLSGGLLIPLAVFSLLAFLFPSGVIPPNPKTQTIFSWLFFLLEVVSHACFIAGGTLAVLYLRQRETARLFHSFIVWGFIFCSVAQVVGAYWAYLGWATPLHWSNRHLQSASLWCFYAALLHLRYLPVWNLRTEARFSLIGLALILLYGYGGALTEANAPPRIGG